MAAQSRAQHPADAESLCTQERRSECTAGDLQAARTRVVVDLEVESEDGAVLGGGGLVAAKERVAVARHLHVELSLEHEAHGPARVERGDGGGAVQKRAPRLLPAKATAQALGLADELVLRHAQHARHELVVLVDVLHA